MIWESNVWKMELKRDITSLKRRLQHAATPSTRGISDQVLAKIEKFSFTSAFIVRKLMEAKKLSDELEGSVLPVQSFPRINAGEQIDFMNWYHLDRFYDFANPNAQQVSARDLCNLLVHSMVFSVASEEDERHVTGFLFNSDWSKDTALMEIKLETYFEFIEGVIRDDVVHMSCDRRTGALIKSRRHTRTHARTP